MGFTVYSATVLLNDDSASLSPAIWVAVFLLVILPIITRRKNEIVAARLIKKRRRNKEERIKMTELAKSFIGKECLIYMLNGNECTGKIIEVTEGALLLEKCSCNEILNLDFILRIREHPMKKNGKKKNIVLD